MGTIKFLNTSPADLWHVPTPSGVAFTARCTMLSCSASQPESCMEAAVLWVDCLASFFVAEITMLNPRLETHLLGVFTVRMTFETPSTNLVRKMTFALLNMPSFKLTMMNCKETLRSMITSLDQKRCMYAPHSCQHKLPQITGWMFDSRIIPLGQRVWPPRSRTPLQLVVQVKSSCCRH